MCPAQFHPDRRSLHPGFWNVCLQVYPTIVSHSELISATETYIHLCENVGFARLARTPSFVAAKMHAVHGLLFCASWLVEQFQAGKHSTSRTPSVLYQRVEEVSDAAFDCSSGEPSDKFKWPRSIPV